MGSWCCYLGNGYGIQGQDYVALLLGSEMSAEFQHRNLILGIYNVLGYSRRTDSSGVVVSKSEFQSSGLGSFPGMGECDFVFHL